MKACEGIFDHSMDKLVTVSFNKETIVKKCPICGFTETLKRSQKSLYFYNDTAVQKKKWASEDNRKELLQPFNNDGSPNEEFTEAYGFNPGDPSTKASTPSVQGGLAK